MLKVTSPSRATVRDQAGLLQVTGLVAPNLEGDRVERVTVNGVPARLGDDGSFVAEVQLAPGATFLQTVARDVAGGEASDTRTVHAGTLRSANDLIDHGLTVAMSEEALTAVATAAGTLMKSTNFAPILAPLNPMVSAGAADGEGCLWGKIYVNDVKMSDARLVLAPKAGGLVFEAEVAQLDVPARARYAAACLEGATDVRITASRVLLTGTLLVTANRAGSGFDVKIAAPQVTIDGFAVSASGLPGEVLRVLDLNHALGSVIATVAETFMSPLMNRALGGLAGPKQVTVAGTTLTFEVATDDVAFDVAGALVALDTRMSLAGSAAQFVYTPDDPIALDPGTGLAVAISDDAANQLLASVTAAGLIDLTMPAIGGTFDSARITATLPPMVAADTRTGKLRVLAGDLLMTLRSNDADVAHISLSIATEVSASPSPIGIALEVGAPEVYADVIDNVTGYADADKEAMIKLVVDNHVALLSLLVGSIPLPTIAGVSLREPRVGAGDGFIKVTGKLR